MVRDGLHRLPQQTGASASPQPESVVNTALATGAIDKDLPFIGREAVASAEDELPLTRGGAEGDPRRPAGFLRGADTRTRCPGQGEGRAAGKVLAEEWAQNNFPDMKVTWGTYVDFLEHDPGCYRCHDKKHANAKGDVVQQKCTGACHDTIATEEEKPEALDVLFR